MCRYAIFINYVDTPHYIYIILEFTKITPNTQTGSCQLSFGQRVPYDMTHSRKREGYIQQLVPLAYSLDTQVSVNAKCLSVDGRNPKQPPGMYKAL